MFDDIRKKGETKLVSPFILFQIFTENNRGKLKRPGPSWPSQQ